jgi:hypothetical protein
MLSSATQITILFSNRRTSWGVLVNRRSYDPGTRSIAHRTPHKIPQEKFPHKNIEFLQRGSSFSQNRFTQCKGSTREFLSVLV